MPATCQACPAAARVYCAQDACWLCQNCDHKAHCGPLTSSHSRWGARLGAPPGHAPHKRLVTSTFCNIGAVQTAQRRSSLLLYFFSAGCPPALFAPTAPLRFTAATTWLTCAAVAMTSATRACP
jgi:hypothetical protein